MSDQQPVKVFISHHSSKFGIAEQIEALLVKRGIQCWIAPRDVPPGAQFDTAVHNAIEESAVVLLLFCSNSDKSRHVKRELILGDSAGRPIIPLRLEAIDPGELAYHLADSQWIDWIDRREAVVDRVAAQAFRYANVQPAPAAAVTSSDAGSGAGLTQRGWIFAALAGVVIVVLAAMLLIPRFGFDDPAIETTDAMQAAESDIAIAEGAAVGVDTLDGGATGAAETSAPPVTGPASTIAAPPTISAAPVPTRTIVQAASGPTVAGPTVAGPLQRVVQACAGSASDAEYLICAQPELGESARGMSALIREIRAGYEAAGTDAGTFNAEQRQWMNGIKASCHSAACVEARQAERVAALRAITATLD